MDWLVYSFVKTGVYSPRFPANRAAGSVQPRRAWDPLRSFPPRWPNAGDLPFVARAAKAAWGEVACRRSLRLNVLLDRTDTRSREAPMSNRVWLFVCSCIALVTSAFTFVIHADIMPDLVSQYDLSQEAVGYTGSAIFTGMALSMLVGAFICDILGMRQIMYLAFLSHLLGALAFIGTPYVFGPETAKDTVQLWIFAACLLLGIGNGMTEVGINPLVASMFPKQKTHFLNILHAWWPGGLVIGGVSVVGLRKLATTGVGAETAVGLIPGFVFWQEALLLIAVPTIIYGAMLTVARFPQTERVVAGVNYGQMLGQIARPLFLIWALCMLLTASTELGVQKWQESVLQSKLGIPGSGTLVLVYTSGMMFVLRHFAGPIAQRISPVGLLLCSAVLSGVGLYLLSFATDAYTAFGYATIYGLGIAYFWPTMLGVTAERFPKGGAMLLSLMGSVGNLAIAVAVPVIGGLADTYQVAHVREESEQYVSVLVTEVDGRAILNRKAIGTVKDVDPQREPEMDSQGQPLEAPLPRFAVITKEGAAYALPVSALKEISTDAEQEAVKIPGVEEGKTITLPTSLVTGLKGVTPDEGNVFLQPQKGTELKMFSAEELLQAARAAESAGFSQAFRWASLLPCILIVLFGSIYLWDISQGGYKPELLLSPEEEAELMSGGVQGPVE